MKLFLCMSFCFLFCSSLFATDSELFSSPELIVVKKTSPLPYRGNVSQGWTRVGFRDPLQSKTINMSKGSIQASLYRGVYKFKGAKLLGLKIVNKSSESSYLLGFEGSRVYVPAQKSFYLFFYAPHNGGKFELMSDRHIDITVVADNYFPDANNFNEWGGDEARANRDKKINERKKSLIFDHKSKDQGILIDELKGDKKILEKAIAQLKDNINFLNEDVACLQQRNQYLEEQCFFYKIEIENQLKQQIENMSIAQNFLIEASTGIEISDRITNYIEKQLLNILRFNNSNALKNTLKNIMNNLKARKQVEESVDSLFDFMEDWKKDLTEKLKDYGPVSKNDFVTINSGSFRMGINVPGGFKESQPVHQVFISKKFAMMKTKVTQRIYATVTGENKSKFRKKEYCPESYTILDGIEMCPEHPVENVSFDDGNKFIIKLAERGGPILRYCTEAEREYVARAGTTTDLSFGNEQRFSKGYAWLRNNSKGHTHPVATKRPNPWGLYDMHGNVHEWFSDFYAPFSASRQVDPKGPKEGQARVFRGGCWNDYCYNALSGWRQRDTLNAANEYIGLRFCKTL